MNNIQKLAQKEYEHGAILRTYASGDGSLSFVWNKSGYAKTVKTTREDIEAFLDRTWPTYKGWRVLEKWEGEFCLYQPVKRVDEKTVKIDGVEYEYLQHRNLFGIWNSFGEEILNLSFKSRIKFFLENEEAIVEAEKDL